MFYTLHGWSIDSLDDAMIFSTLQANNDYLQMEVVAGDSDDSPFAFY